ncbi:MAG: histidine phosphatase family protein [bacterium]|nr:histidine phosphatase family protein [bacterium]
MRKFQITLLIIILFSALPSFLYSQEHNITTVILVRHAEKESDGTNDPALTSEGMERAQDLAYLMNSIELDAIFHTQYKRTKMTVEPTANSKAIQMQMIPSLKPADLKNFTDKMLADYEGRRVLIASHSNIVPALIKLIKGDEVNYRTLKFIHDKIYDDIFVVYFNDRENATVLNLKYGKRTEIR